MADLTADKRRQMPRSEFGQPEKRGFPMNDKTHDRLAISGATKAHEAGHISASEEERIKSEARGKLHGGDPKGGDSPADHKSAVAKMHPEHVHKLVKDAHAGKFGPEAQKAAQSAMNGPEGGSPGGDGSFQPGDEAGDAGGGNPQPQMGARAIFGGGSDGGDEPDDDQGTAGPDDARAIFGRR